MIYSRMVLIKQKIIILNLIIWVVTVNAVAVNATRDCCSWRSVLPGCSGRKEHASRHELLRLAAPRFPGPIQMLPGSSLGNSISRASSPSLPHLTPSASSNTETWGLSPFTPRIASTDRYGSISLVRIGTSKHDGTVTTTAESAGTSKESRNSTSRPVPSLIEGTDPHHLVGIELVSDQLSPGTAPNAERVEGFISPVRIRTSKHDGTVTTTAEAADGTRIASTNRYESGDGSISPLRIRTSNNGSTVTPKETIADSTHSEEPGNSTPRSVPSLIKGTDPHHLVGIELVSDQLSPGTAPNAERVAVVNVKRRTPSRTGAPSRRRAVAAQRNVSAHDQNGENPKSKALARLIGAGFCPELLPITEVPFESTDGTEEVVPGLPCNTSESVLLPISLMQSQLADVATNLARLGLNHEEPVHYNPLIFVDGCLVATNSLTDSSTFKQAFPALTESFWWQTEDTSKTFAERVLVELYHFVTFLTKKAKFIVNDEFVTATRHAFDRLIREADAKYEHSYNTHHICTYIEEYFRILDKIMSEQHKD